jgi:hypothetical protein
MGATPAMLAGAIALFCRTLHFVAIDQEEAQSSRLAGSRSMGLDPCPHRLHPSASPQHEPRKPRLR